jgi:hypothetical protein
MSSTVTVQALPGFSAMVHVSVAKSFSRNMPQLPSSIDKAFYQKLHLSTLGGYAKNPSLKIPEDAFVQLGILQDDSPTVVHGIDVQQVVGVQAKKGDAFTGVEFCIEGMLASYDRDQFMAAIAKKKAGKKKPRRG